MTESEKPNHHSNFYFRWIALACVSLLAFGSSVGIDDACSQEDYWVYELSGFESGDSYESVAAAGDVNGDGYADIVVSTRKNFTHSSVLRVFSGKDRKVLHTFTRDEDDEGPWYEYLFGPSVAGVGDINQDGCDDVIVKFNLYLESTPRSGLARVFSGRDGSTLYNFYVSTPFDFSVAGAGDVNRDGYADVVIGEPGLDRANIFSGRDGSTLHTLKGPIEVR